MTDETGTDRRRFLKIVAGFGAIASSLLAGLPALRAFASPLSTARRGPQWVRLGEAEQFEFGTPTRVDFAETIQDAWIESRAARSVWVVTDDGETFTVFNGRCTHLACSYAFLENQKLFRCPCHNGSYDVKTGAVLGGPPPRPLDKLETKVEHGYLYAAFENYRPGVPEKTPV